LTKKQHEQNTQKTTKAKQHALNDSNAYETANESILDSSGNSDDLEIPLASLISSTASNAVAAKSNTTGAKKSNEGVGGKSQAKSQTKPVVNNENEVRSEKSKLVSGL